jgi:hypothetical protein
VRNGVVIKRFHASGTCEGDLTLAGHVSQGAVSRAMAEPTLHDAFPYIRDAPVTEAKRQRSVLASPDLLIAGRFTITYVAITS